MAFLDNSGDIILDAVLTETGRRRMAQGDFQIDKFALGDDEIDYSLYNKNHPSGSAYYDLEILQTPIFEAFTQINAGINYGLLPITAVDLLYLPIMKVNELSRVKDEALGNLITSSGSSGVFFVVDNSSDTTGNAVSDYLTNSGSVDYIVGQNPSNFVLFESGLDTGTSSTPLGTEQNRTDLLVNNSLVDEQIYVYYDNRFFSGVKGGAAPSGLFSNPSSTLQANFTLQDARPLSLTSGLENYSSAAIEGINNEIYYSTSGNTDSDFSVINGPRGIAGVIAPVLKDLDSEYTLYGGTTSDFGVGMVFIDTTIYLQGFSSQATLQIPIRIIRFA